MQKFIEADYYELDWYYEECSDGNDGLARHSAAGMCRGIVSREGGGREGAGEKEGAPAASRHACLPGVVGDGRWSEGAMVLQCWAREHRKLHWILCGARGECGIWCVRACASGDVFAVLRAVRGAGDPVFKRWLSGPAAAAGPGQPALSRTQTCLSPRETPEDVAAAPR